ARNYEMNSPQESGLCKADRAAGGLVKVEQRTDFGLATAAMSRLAESDTGGSTAPQTPASRSRPAYYPRIRGSNTPAAVTSHPRPRPGSGRDTSPASRAGCAGSNPAGGAHPDQGKPRPTSPNAGSRGFVHVQPGEAGGTVAYARHAGSGQGAADQL